MAARRAAEVRRNAIPAAKQGRPRDRRHGNKQDRGGDNPVVAEGGRGITLVDNRTAQSCPDGTHSKGGQS
jgi:hypothetical protein